MMNTFNKIWIVPEKAVVYEHGQTAFVVESHLKVMLEEDYVALEQYGNVGAGLKPARTDDYHPHIEFPCQNRALIVK